MRWNRATTVIILVYLDQSFVRDLESDHSNVAIVRTIVTLGQSLGLAVIAEGVETETARERLAAIGCDRFQGYYFARPMPIEELERALAAGRCVWQGGAL